MAERVSALAGHYEGGHFGNEGDPGVSLSDVGGLLLHQVAAWPDTLSAVGEKAAQAARVEAAPGPQRAAASSSNIGSTTRPPCASSKNSRLGIYASW